MRIHSIRLLPFFLIGLSLAVLLAACVLTPAATSIPTIPPTPTVLVASPAPATLRPDPGRYSNAEGGFSLVLPEGWSAAGPLPIDGDPQRPYNLYVLGTDPASSGGPGASKIAILDPQQWTPEDFALAQCTTCPVQPFEDVTLGGKPARRTQVGGGDVPFMVTWTFVENQGKLIALDIHDPDSLEPLEDVLQSITFE
jgi:hypothetical protein